MKWTKYMIVMLAAALCAACSDHDETAPAPGEGEPVEFDFSIGSAVESRAGQEVDDLRKRAFVEGEKIAIFNENTNEQGIYRLEQGKWNYLSGVRHVWNAPSMAFTVSTFSDYLHLPNNQQNCTADELDLVSSSQEVNKADGAVKMELQHTRCHITVVITELALDLGSNCEIDYMHLLSRSEQGNTAWTKITPKRMAKDQLVWVALLEPNPEAAPQEDFITLGVTKLSTGLFHFRVVGVPLLEAGHAYRYELKVGKEGIVIQNITVEPWEEQPEWVNPDPVGPNTEVVFN